jgi:hypothetical protein
MEKVSLAFCWSCAGLYLVPTHYTSAYYDHICFSNRRKLVVYDNCDEKEWLANVELERQRRKKLYKRKVTTHQ